MKIAFVGKGGSGKTTATALFGRWLAAQGATVVAFDGDINQHLFQALGAQAGDSPIALAPRLAEIKNYLRGDNPRIASVDAMVKTTPPGGGSRLLRANPAKDDFLKGLLTKVNDVWSGAAGEIDEADLGVKCFHGKSGVIELLLGHMVDTENEYVLVDLTAGADPFASSILGKVDAVVLVVEPQLPSLGVYQQFKCYVPDWAPPLVVVGNKIDPASDDEVWLQGQLGDDLLGTLPISPFVKSQARGTQQDISKLEPEAQALFATLRTHISRLPRDLNTYQARSYALHHLNAAGWANDATGRQLQEQIDPGFSLSQAAEGVLALS